jgi:hypothetical protein
MQVPPFVQSFEVEQRAWQRPSLHTSEPLQSESTVQTAAANLPGSSDEHPLWINHPAATPTKMETRLARTLRMP